MCDNQKTNRVLNPNGKINANLTKQGGGKLQREHPDIWRETWDLSGHHDTLYRSGKPKAIPLVERVRWWISGRVNYCRTCGVPIEEHAIYCGKKCSANDPDVLEKRKTTRRENMGGAWMPDDWVPTGWASPEGHERALQKRRENNGGLYWTQEMTDKARRTKQDNWGDQNIHVTRAQETIQREHGVNNPAHVPGASEKISKSLKGFRGRNPDFDIIGRDDEWLHYHLTEYGRQWVAKRLNCSIPWLVFREVECGFREIKTSSMETHIENFLSKDLGITPVMRTRTVIRPNELDVYLPDHAIAIEIDGDYWHSADSEERFQELLSKHQWKERECWKMGITLIRIQERQWNQYESECRKALSSIITGETKIESADSSEVAWVAYKVFEAEGSFEQGMSKAPIAPQFDQVLEKFKQ